MKQSFAFAFIIGLSMRLCASTLDEFAADWLPLSVEPDVAPGSALDFSGMLADRAPCGAHGRVVVRGGHFEYENRPGEPLRFWGVNLCGGANFPDIDKAEEIAARFAALGYNSVRLHHHDSGLVGGNSDAFGPAGSGDDASSSRDGGGAVATSTGLDPDALRRMDALVAALGRRGIHVITDLYVSRPVSWRSCGIDRDGVMSKGQFKHLAPIHEGAFSNFCAFAAAWLNHTNEFTGVRFADDPTLMALALINEGNLDNGAGPEPFVSLPNWREKWEAWLAEKKAADPAAFSDIPATIPEGNHWSRTRHVAAFSRFLAEVETDFEARAVRFLREQVGLKAPISNMSAWMNPPEYQIPLAGPSIDYVESHSYCDHPTFPERQWGLPCLVGSENPVRQRLRSLGYGAMGGTLKRIFGKPHVVTEFNYVAPNPHRGAGGLLFGAEAAAQDWDGAWRFDWASSKNGVEEPGTGYCGLFAINCDPLRQASDRLAQMLFVRGDLAPCRDAYAVWMPPSKITGVFDGESHQLNTPWPELTWRARLGTVVGEEPPAWARWVDPYPDYYKRDAPVAAGIPQRDDIALDREAGWFKVSTPRTCAVFAEGGAHEAGALKVEVPTACTAGVQGGAASVTVWATSLDGAPLAETRRVLVGMLTDLRNTGMETEEREEGASSLSGGKATLVRKWGGLPHLVRRGTARVELELADGDWMINALSLGGIRRFEVPCERSESGRIAFSIDNAADPASATLFWELSR